MILQYLKDNDDTTMAVVISISDWEKITQTHQDINLMIEVKTTNSQKSKPSVWCWTTSILISKKHLKKCYLKRRPKGY